MANIKASIITIGDELLIGQTIDTNSAWIARQLNALGIDVVRRIAVGDNAPDIRKALDEEIAASDTVLITGGLGPTADDITKPLLCEYFGGKLKVDERVLEHVKEMFVRRNRPFLERNLKQAEVPDNCTVLFNRMGTAPGMLFEKNGKLIISMPGVPFEMMAIMEDGVLPLYKSRFKSDAMVHRTLITAGEGESFIAERIADIENALPPYIRLAYLPSLGMVKLRLTGRRENEEGLIGEVEAWQHKLYERLANIVVAAEDIPFEQILGNLLNEKGATIALAESCTGGYISHLITQVAGASKYLKGCIVPYLIEVKENVLGVQKETLDAFGAVSEPVAKEMAERVREKLNSDYSISITGILDIDRVEGETAAPRTAWIAVASATETQAKEFRFNHDRIRNKESAAIMAMFMLWKFIKDRS